MVGKAGALQAQGVVEVAALHLGEPLAGRGVAR